ncbi:MAG: hypothetical protein QOG18_1116 [Microbacteriaceae bacterium]|nr:hypothetical protein [Microbacteriaceae bacterium]
MCRNLHRESVQLAALMGTDASSIGRSRCSGRETPGSPLELGGRLDTLPKQVDFA